MVLLLQRESSADVTDPAYAPILELMAAVDSFIATPQVDEFLMPIEDAVTITGRGTVVTGRLEAWGN